MTTEELNWARVKIKSIRSNLNDLSQFLNIVEKDLKENE